ncbi:MAG: hypothetical protein RKE49_01785 [Oceanicaulis sp.]
MDEIRVNTAKIANTSDNRDRSLELRFVTYANNTSKAVAASAAKSAI